MNAPTGNCRLPRFARLIAVAAVALPLFTLTGCMAPNGFSQFYNACQPSTSTELLQWSGHTTIYRSADPIRDGKDLQRKGYIPLGQCGFQTAGNVTEHMIMSQASKVGADIVLYKVDYLGTQQTAMPYLQYQPGQTYTTTSSGMVTANAYGSGGYASGLGTYYGTSTTTTPGTFSTQMVPVTLNFYGHVATFWRKAAPPPLGIYVMPLTDTLKAELQRNSGVVVDVVVDNSPAFESNILVGDIILKYAGEMVGSVDDFVELRRKSEGQKIEIEIWRKGESKTISVQLRSLSKDHREGQPPIKAPPQS